MFTESILEYIIESYKKGGVYSEQQPICQIAGSRGLSGNE